MDTINDYQRFAILYVDDEQDSLRAFTHAFEDQFRIYTATSAREGLKLVEEHRDEIGVLMTDQQMPGERGVWLLEQVRQLQPRIVRILATGYTDITAAIAAVNTGAIYKYINKPFDMPQLEVTLKRALEFFIIQQERDQLLHEKLSVLRNMMITDRIVSLGLLAAGLSHHIRNSLVAVQTFLDLAPAKMEQEKADAQGLRDPEFWSHYYQNVQSQIGKIDKLLRDLWTASENPAFQFADQVRVHQVVAEVIGQLQPAFAQKKITLENQVPDDLPELSVDKPKFYRLFELLLKDELASLPEGSHIRFSARPHGVETGRKQQVEIFMTDNGPGLPKEALRLVFDPFVVRADVPAEYGINLMACFFIVHHHGGQIEARSEPGPGTTFTLRMPTQPGQVPAASADDTNFFRKLLLNDSLWKDLISSQ